MFPNYKRKFFKKVPDEWKDLGKMNFKIRVVDGKEIESCLCCKYCNDILHVGKEEDGTSFHFCKRCMKKYVQII
jgi:hypothetical protein